MPSWWSYIRFYVSIAQQICSVFYHKNEKSSGCIDLHRCKTWSSKLDLTNTSKSQREVWRIIFERCNDAVLWFFMLEFLLQNLYKCFKQPVKKIKIKPANQVFDLLLKRKWVTSTTAQFPVKWYLVPIGRRD